MTDTHTRIQSQDQLLFSLVPNVPMLIERHASWADINTLVSDICLPVTPPWTRSNTSHQIYQSRSCRVINYFYPFIIHDTQLILYAAIRLCHEQLYKNKKMITSVPKKTFRYGNTRRHYVCLYLPVSFQPLIKFLARRLLSTQHDQFYWKTSSLVLHLRRWIHHW